MAPCTSRSSESRNVLHEPKRSEETGHASAAGRTALCSSKISFGVGP